MLRLRHHHVRFVCPLLDGDDPGFYSRFAFGLVLGALTNLADNAFYWLRVGWPDVSVQGDGPERKLYIALSHDFEAGPAIVVADNGPGFQGDDPGNLVRPFFTWFGLRAAQQNRHDPGTGTTGLSVTPSSRATVDQVRFRQPPTSAGPSSRFYLPASARRAA